MGQHGSLRVPHPPRDPAPHASTHERGERAHGLGRGGRGGGRLGLDPASPFFLAEGVREAVAGDFALVDAGPAIQECRGCKSASEIALMQRAKEMTLEAHIAAASILAKTARDAEMLRLHARFPQFGFDRHKGYPTKAHIEALQRLGVTYEYCYRK